MRDRDIKFKSEPLTPRRKIKRVCVQERERVLFVCVCVCVRERERERERVKN